jgi:hopanoid biosynthesis associated protein HpnK
MDNKDLNRRYLRYLVIVADDLGRSSSVNLAIAKAHDRGIVTAASLMAGGEAFQEAVEIALKRSQLSVGLHVTLCDGRAVLPPSHIPDLVDPDGYFEKRPAMAWLRYTKPGLLPQIESEIEAQFDRMEKSGIHPTHVDGHHHLHMHPLIFKVLCRQASQRGVSWIRLPRESLSLVLNLRSPLRGAMPFIEWAVFGILGTYNLRIARKYGLHVVCHVYGLSLTGSIDEKFLLDILNCSSGSLNEIFTHPDISVESGRRELEALTSIKVRNRLSPLGMALVGYRELSERAIFFESVWESL